MKEQLLKMPTHRLLLIGWSLPLLLCAALASYVIKPQFNAWQSARTSIADTSAVTTSVDLDAQLDWLRRETEALEQRLHGDGASLPAREMESFVIGRLQTISWSNDMELIGITPAEGSLINGYQELLFDVQLEGGYFNFYSWLRQVSAQLGFVVVKHFDIERAAKSDNAAPRLKLRLTMAAYRRVT